MRPVAAAFSKASYRASSRSRRGSVLVVALVATVVLGLLAVTLAQIVCDEQQIAANSTDAEEALCLAEAGLADVVWRLTYDDAWSNGFRSGSGWNAKITRTATNGLRPNRSYQVSVVGLDPGSALVKSTAMIARSGGFARRTVIAHIAQAYPQPPHFDLSAIMAGGWDAGSKQFENGNIEIAAQATITGGMLANNDVIIDNRSTKGVDLSTDPVIWDGAEWIRGTHDPYGDNVTGLAVNELDISQSPITVDGQQINASCEGTAGSFVMPALDLDYLRQQADYYYTEDELWRLLQAGSVTLTGVVFIEGDVEVPSARELTINGVLVATGNVEMLGESSELTVKRNPNDDEWHDASGIVCRGDIMLQGDYYIEGLVYSLGTVDLKGEKPEAVRTILGSVCGRQVQLKGREELIVALDPESRAWIEVLLTEAGVSGGETTTLRVDAWNEVY